MKAVTFHGRRDVRVGPRQEDGNAPGPWILLTAAIASDRVRARIDVADAARAGDQIEEAIRSQIQEFAGPAAAVFRSAPPTREGLLEAARQVEQLRLRMISPETMQLVAERARRIIAEA